jgi:hypothetical protein
LPSNRWQADILCLQKHYCYAKKHKSHHTLLPERGTKKTKLLSATKMKRWDKSSYPSKQNKWRKINVQFGHLDCSIAINREHQRGGGGKWEKKVR